MRLTSTLNPQSTTEENIPVAVFRYNGQRKFLRLAKDYNGMVNTVLHAFDIEKAPLSLQISSLDACRGESVEIDESAYPFMCSVLDDVDVIVGAMERLVTSGHQNDTGERSLPTPTASTSRTPSSSHRDADITVRDTTARDDADRSSHTGSPLPPNSEYDDEREVEQMDEFATVNENDREPDVVEPRAEEAEEKEEEPRRPWNLQDRTVSRAGPAEGTPNRQKFKPVSKPSALADAEDYSTYVKKEKEATPDIPSSKADLPPAKSSRTPRGEPHNVTTSFADPESRFEISIAGPEPGQTAQFKTRGKHSVGKVLAAACRTFNLDASRARLFYIKSFKNSDGEMERCEVECDMEETMAQFNGVINPQIFVKLDEPSVEGDDGLLDFN